jgi:para-aminobenzoate synthetase component 1
MSMTETMNDYAKRNIPFLFIIDFDQVQPIIIPITQAAAQGIFFDINGFRNFGPTKTSDLPIQIKKHPIPYSRYESAFRQIQQNIYAGHSYLTNLTFPTRIDLNLPFRDIFLRSETQFKLWVRDQFVVFSPERFVNIRDGKIFSYPMKGTIDASVPNALEKLLKDQKEKAEHYTIVDLIRNDLSRVAGNVQVEMFRYVDSIKTHGNTLLQTSSKIIGRLPSNYKENVGTLLDKLLPAGSITGAPKQKTVEIIKSAEQYERGYYTGVFGYYQNGIMESAVMIRYIEQQGDQYFFKSGGGITAQSDPQKEYQELIDKVYVPIIRKHQNQGWANIQSSAPRATIK